VVPEGGYRAQEGTAAGSPHLETVGVQGVVHFLHVRPRAATQRVHHPDPLGRQ
jgi:hypothetical protein